VAQNTKLVNLTNLNLITRQNNLLPIKILNGFIKQNPNLVSLAVILDDLIVLEDLHSATLKHLNIKNGTTDQLFNFESLFAVIKTLPALQTLEFDSFTWKIPHGPFEAVIKTLLSHCPKLRVLHLSRFPLVSEYKFLQMCKAFPELEIASDSLFASGNSLVKFEKSGMMFNGSYLILETGQKIGLADCLRLLVSAILADGTFCAHH